MSDKKILIIHDRFMFRGGAERLVLDMARGLNADLATGFWSDNETFPREDVPNKLFVLGHFSQKSGWRYLKFQLIFYFKTKFIRDYDVVIFSGNNCLSAAHNVKPGARKIFYCHTPVRHAYDLKKYYLSHMPRWKSLIFRFLIFGSRVVYKYGFRQMDVVIANSRNVQQRIRKYLKSESRVVYPPIQTDKFRWQGQKDYYLSFARVDRLKRVGDIVKAFQQMPDKKLIMVSSGDDIDNVKALAAGYDNIQILGWVNDDELAELVGNCIATIYIPRDEDFGMTQIESLSAGKPVIGVNEGGLAETIEDSVTGRLIPSNYLIKDIVQAVEDLPVERASAMRDTCIQAAQKYSVDRFVKEMQEVVDKAGKQTVIGIDANQANRIKRTGVEWYAWHLLSNMKSITQAGTFKDIQFRLYSTEPLVEDVKKLPENWHSRVLPWVKLRVWNMWTQVRLSFEMWRNPPDIYLAPGYTLPLVHPKKSFVVIHDLGYLHYPKYYNFISRWYYRLLSWYSLKVAYGVIVPSDYTKQDIIKKYNYPDEKIYVTHLGYNQESFRPIDDNVKISRLLQEYKIAQPYILYIGRLNKKKNILGIVKAFHQLKSYPKFSKLQLVLGGWKQYGWAEAEKYIAAHNLTSQVKALDHVPVKHVPMLINGARVFVFPSFFEGFGLPVLEAMACGRPVVCSNTTSLPEVAGEGAVLVNPENEGEIAQAIEKILSDDEFKQDLVKKSLKQAQQFSWEKMAQQTIDILIK